MPIEQLWAIRGQLLEAEPLLRFRLSELRRRILLQALRSAGASQLQIIAFGVVPQVITAWIAVVLYRFEVNLRSATVLGMVGAGGLGFELVSSLKPVDRAVLGKSGDKYKVVEEIRPDIIAIGYDQPFNEKVLEDDLRKRGLEVKVVRMSGYSDDLDGTRKIIRRIIEWHSSNCHGGDS